MTLVDDPLPALDCCPHPQTAYMLFIGSYDLPSLPQRTKDWRLHLA